MKIIILGPTGSGKGTQAEFISKFLKLKHIEAGAILRKKAEKNKFIKSSLDAGKIVPTNIVVNIIKKEVKTKKNLILDGFPRTMSQLKKFNIKPDLVLYLNVSKSHLINRLLLRKREDDTKENIEKRYYLFLKKSLPVINYYKKKKLLVRINGNPSIDRVSKNIKKILIKYQQQP